MNTKTLRFRLMLWYAFWLTVALVVVGASVYLGLHQYLERRLAIAQSQRAERIAVLLLRAPSEKTVVDDITTRFAPEATGRFIRVTRPDRTVLYHSEAPHDHSFDPSHIPPPTLQVGKRKETLADGTELIIQTIAAGSAANPKYYIEAGEPLTSALSEIKRLLQLFVLGFLAVACMAVGGGYLLVGHALRPVEEIIRSAEQITSHNLNERLKVLATGDEFEHLAKALNRMITRLDDAFQHNRRFLADASHELRTPLTIIRGELENLLREDGLTEAQRDQLASTLEEAERLARIVEGLFALARLDAGEAQAEFTRFDLSLLTISTADQMLLLAEDKGIKVVTDCTETVLVNGDQARVKQIIVNLLDNAIKYTHEGGTIHLRTVVVNSQAILEVEDNGMGMPEQALPHVFERFYRVDKARSREQGGAGLGLSIVKSICHAHGGTVEAQSILGKGSKFRVSLPSAAMSISEKKEYHE